VLDLHQPVANRARYAACIFTNPLEPTMRRLATLSFLSLTFAVAPMARAADEASSADKPAMAASMAHDCKMMKEMHGKDGADKGKSMGMGGKQMGCMDKPATKAKAAAKPKSKSTKAPEHDHETHTTK
jgi:hypothetical protein